MIIKQSLNINNKQTPQKKFDLKSFIKKFKLPEEEEKAIHTAVATAASYKGYPWSESEFSCEAANTKWNMVESKYGEKSAKIFDILLNKMPPIASYFNSYSGD